MERRIIFIISIILGTSGCASWLETGFYSKKTDVYRGADLSAFQGNLYPGMTMDHVRESWGEPDRREVAGSRESGFERWIYPVGGYSGRDFGTARIVYFESGQVSGWQTEALGAL